MSKKLMKNYPGGVRNIAVRRVGFQRRVIASHPKIGMTSMTHIFNVRSTPGHRRWAYRPNSFINAIVRERSANHISRFV